MKQTSIVIYKQDLRMFLTITKNILESRPTCKAVRLSLRYKLVNETSYLDKNLKTFVNSIAWPWNIFSQG